jgi:hypothetical protein
MSRWLLAGGLLVLAFACKAKSYTPNDGSDDGGAGDDAGDDGGACTCEVPNSIDGGTVSEVDIPCGESACVGETAYVCTTEGTPLPTGACGAATDASFQEEGECVPSCTGTMCNVSDSCGGTCACAAGVPCNPNGTCGNGCDLGVGDVCLEDAGSATTCCSSGYVCFAHEAGASACCAAVGGGHCSQDTDCCDYPAAHCSTTTGTCG